MADNVVANAGSGGATFASDDIGGVQFPRAKICWGPDGTANDADVASGKPLPTQIRSSAGTELATAGAPLRTDPTGTTTQPVSGAVTVSGTATVTAAAAFPVTDNSGSLTVDGSVTADTELPAAAALADAAGNPTTPIVGAALLEFNGTTWDRARGDSTNGVDVDVTRLPSLVAGSAKIGQVDLDSDATTGSGVPATAQFVAGTDGTNARGLKTDSSGELQVDVLTIPSVAQATPANLKCEPQGPVAAGSAPSGNPLRMGAKASSSEPAKVDDGDLVDPMKDLAGRQVISPISVFELQTTARANLTDNADTQLLAADASYKYAVMAILVTNAHASVSTKVSLRDGTTDKLKGFAKANGGGFALNGGGIPLFIGTVNTALKVQCGTTGSDIEVFVTVAKVK